MGKFVVRTTNTGVKFDLKATNGQVTATSEGYTTLANCFHRDHVGRVPDVAPFMIEERYLSIL